MLAAMRQNRILALLEENSSVRTTELAKAFDVVPETIRRDFEELEQKGLLVRIHGGAVTPSTGEKESRTVIREFTNYQVKEELCRLAEKELKSGDYAFVDNSTTLVNLVRLVDGSKMVSLLTNSVRLLLEAERYNKNNVTMISMGGVLSTYNMSLSGQLNEEMAGGLYPNKAFVSCTGFALDTGFTDTSVFEINAKTRMMGLASQVIMVMDHSKFEKRGLIRFGDLTSCDVLITDRLPDKAYREKMLALHPGLKVIEAGGHPGKQATP
ncbi:MAG: DeoR/GlpR family DNA-binding transcription regulator [Eubacteriales bacterium]|nr:DeoR/GlpR family DNA-binding transcription regulator [Eubacteriales bacterium]